MSRRILILVLFFALNTAEAVQIIDWKNKPIKLRLVIGHERVIYVDGESRVKPSLLLTSASVFRTQALDGSILWTAFTKFKNQRVQVMLENGRILLFDLTSVRKSKNYFTDDDVKLRFNSVNNVKKSEKNLNVADLMRFASQSLYAPHRFVKTHNEIQPVPHRLPQFIPYFYDKPLVKASPLFAWRYKNYYVTAIGLINLSVIEDEALDPLKLRIEHISSSRKYAVFQHLTLKRQGGVLGENETTVFIVTENPLSQMIVPKEVIESQSKSLSYSGNRRER